MNPEQIELHLKRVLNSYRKWTGTDLLKLTGELSLAEQLNRTGRILLSHGTETDPVLNYGNHAALALWEMDWAEFVRMPSRLTAEPMDREEREKLLRDVRDKGYSNRYAGIRVSRTGRRFRIEDAAIWNVMDERGRMLGQAASFPSWTEVSS
ncbi:MEKHLA domain-containing protein [Cohnella sp. AR92]|uniref:MEKHLA domain-containing protein n=1 Tax=Cohnella sp. AR92 TaxID=648716 RepID=UPI000F8F10B1|nr:MEKHLA domain-containing protein [Cohnella sp. AR92]RUS46154.1 MEKHLA domain-containing protein [Cohnella sp. AR92]